MRLSPPHFLFFTHSEELEKVFTENEKERISVVCMAFIYPFAIFVHVLTWDSKEKRTN